MAMKKTTQSKTDIQNQGLTPEEQQRLDRYKERANKEPLKFKQDENSTDKRAITFKNPDDNLRWVKFCEATGTPDMQLQGFLLEQAIEAFKGSNNDEKLTSLVNNALAFLNGIQPQDELEGIQALIETYLTPDQQT